MMGVPAWLKKGAYMSSQVDDEPKSTEIIKLISKLGWVELNLNAHTHCSLEMISQIPCNCGLWRWEQTLSKSLASPSRF